MADKNSLKKDIRQGNEGEYVLIVWPFSQSLMELDGFEENATLSLDGSSDYFVSKDWLKEQDLL